MKMTSSDTFQFTIHCQIAFQLGTGFEDKLVLTCLAR